MAQASNTSLLGDRLVPSIVRPKFGALTKIPLGILQCRRGYAVTAPIPAASPGMTPGRDQSQGPMSPPGRTRLRSTLFAATYAGRGRGAFARHRRHCVAALTGATRDEPGIPLHQAPPPVDQCRRRSRAHRLGRLRIGRQAAARDAWLAETYSGSQQRRGARAFAAPSTPPNGLVAIKAGAHGGCLHRPGHPNPDGEQPSATYQLARGRRDLTEALWSPRRVRNRLRARHRGGPRHVA